ncbi:Mannosyl-glycoprotein endo-beta-N-acetylglucosaminidase [Leminorella richardii]|uniref:Mannosyl-glycoprotein endo-beta-N-acetylglucosaminidase n=1 Tax=Leminorella richardii TaxID=158841 RepID=A0A2X4UWN2_9GAMM|nr:protein bax [Leminorella richardii]SQI42839.1 Mannosyl-glycoprotein endo-beta-N-acetylglucosaminidase [Leminorella richardii]
MTSLVFKIIGSAVLILSMGLSSAWASTGTMSHQEYSLNDKLESLPDLRKYPSGTQRKKAFLNAVVPIIDKQNALIRQDREWLLRKRLSQTWSVKDIARLQQICSNYRMQCVSDPKKVRWGELLKRVDTLPTHLVVAQAAAESGWGTSKLAQVNNNLFGMRCGSKSCGDTGSVKGYSSYGSVDDSVRAYMLNMNSHGAYNKLRESRAELRNQGDTVTADHLVNKLGRYSERGASYSRFLQRVLDNNEHLIIQAQNDVDTAALRDES